MAAIARLQICRWLRCVWMHVLMIYRTTMLVCSCTQARMYGKHAERHRYIQAPVHTCAICDIFVYIVLHAYIMFACWYTKAGSLVNYLNYRSGRRVINAQCFHFFDATPGCIKQSIVELRFRSVMARSVRISCSSVSSFCPLMLGDPKQILRMHCLSCQWLSPYNLYRCASHIQSVFASLCSIHFSCVSLFIAA